MSWHKPGTAWRLTRFNHQINDLVIHSEVICPLGNKCVRESATCNLGSRDWRVSLKSRLCAPPSPVLQGPTKMLPFPLNEWEWNGPEHSPLLACESLKTMYIWFVFRSSKHLVPGRSLAPICLVEPLGELLHNSHIDSVSTTRMAVRTWENLGSSGSHHQRYKPTWTPPKSLMLLFLLAVGMVHTLVSSWVKGQAGSMHRILN